MKQQTKMTPTHRDADTRIIREGGGTRTHIVRVHQLTCTHANRRPNVPSSSRPVAEALTPVTEAMWLRDQRIHNHADGQHNRCSRGRRGGAARAHPAAQCPYQCHLCTVNVDLDLVERQLLSWSCPPLRRSRRMHGPNVRFPIVRIDRQTSRARPPRVRTPAVLRAPSALPPPRRRTPHPGREGRCCSLPKKKCARPWQRGGRARLLGRERAQAQPNSICELAASETYRHSRFARGARHSGRRQAAASGGPAPVRGTTWSRRRRGRSRNSPVIQRPHAGLFLSLGRMRAVHRAANVPWMCGTR